jgi:predicted enzyme related to lactoylglutathione lyase
MGGAESARFVCGVLVTAALAGVSPVSAQDRGIHVRAIRVLATDPDALAIFYQKAFGMSETGRPMNTPTFKEIVINSGSTAAEARAGATTPLVIATRPKDAPAGALASLILEVPDIEKAIEAVKASGGSLFRPVAKTTGLLYAFVKDPDGNQIELLMPAR